MIFSVIVAFLNEARYIKQCIDSLRNQDFDKNEYELIFVDNGSTDSSREIVQEFSGINLLQEKKRSAFAARNRGLQIARGEIIAFTDADCIVSRDWLSQIYNGMNSSGAKVVLGKCSFPRNSSYLVRMFGDYQNAKSEYVLGNCSPKYFFGFTNNMAVRNEIFKGLGLFLEWEVGGDTEFIQRYISSYRNPRIVYLEGMEITHLEIANIRMWLRKIHIYGKYNRQLEKISNYRRLEYSTNWRIYMFCSKKNGYGFWKRVVFVFLLALGNLAYETGRIRGYFRHSPKLFGKA